VRQCINIAGTAVDVDCPKCRAALPDAAAECPHCGIILAKYLEREESVPPPIQNLVPASGSTTQSDPESIRALAQLFIADKTPSTAAVAGRAIFLVFLAVVTAPLVGGVSAERGMFIDIANLVFHEAGHILFSPFGRFMTVLGGSLTQVLVPLLCAGAFLWQTRDPFAAAFGIWWAGESLTDLAPYIGDARDLKLVLLGGKTGAEVEGHDWEYLLNALGVAHKDHAIASVVQVIGILTMIGALVWGALVVWNQIGMLRRSRPIDL